MIHMSKARGMESVASANVYSNPQVLPMWWAHYIIIKCSKVQGSLNCVLLERKEVMHNE